MGLSWVQSNIQSSQGLFGILKTSLSLTLCWKFTPMSNCLIFCQSQAILLESITITKKYTHMTIKKFLDGEVFYEPQSQTIYVITKDKSEVPLANVRGWSAIVENSETIEDATRMQDALGEFIAQAIRVALIPKTIKKQSKMNSEDFVETEFVENEHIEVDKEYL